MALYVAAQRPRPAGCACCGARSRARFEATPIRTQWGTPMQTSRDRILTTHTGSLPRPPGLRDLLVKKDQGEPYDTAELQRQTSAAVIAIVKRQAEAGVDVINDGEMSKPGYSTYVADRLTGFAGHEPAKPRLDTRDHPNFMAAYTRMTGDNVARRAVCVGPIELRHSDAVG